MSSPAVTCAQNGGRQLCRRYPGAAVRSRRKPDNHPLGTVLGCPNLSFAFFLLQSSDANSKLSHCRLHCLHGFCAVFCDVVVSIERCDVQSNDITSKQAQLTRIMFVHASAAHAHDMPKAAIITNKCYLIVIFINYKPSD